MVGYTLLQNVYSFSDHFRMLNIKGLNKYHKQKERTFLSTKKLYGLNFVLDRFLCFNDCLQISLLILSKLK